MKQASQITNPKAMVEEVLNSPKGKEVQDTISQELGNSNGNAEMAFRNKCIEMGIDPDMGASILKKMFHQK